MGLSPEAHSQDRPGLRPQWTAWGGAVAALFGSLCCIGPLLFVTFGVGAGLASTFEPLRPLFGVAMIVLYGLGFLSVYGRGRWRPGRESAEECVVGEACPPRSSRMREQTILWIAVLLGGILWTFPTWSLWLL